MKPSDVDITAGGDESSSDDDDDSNSDEEEDEDMEDTESDDGIGKPANSKKPAAVEVDEEMTVLKQQLKESTIEDDHKQLPEVRTTTS